MKRKRGMIRKMKILLKNIGIVTLSNNEYISNGYIGIEDSKIVYVGQEKPDFIADTIIDGKNKLAMPGLINSHTHSPMTLLRSYADDMNLEKWLFDYIFPVEEKLKADDIYWGSMLAIAEMIKSGTTCFADMYYFMDEVGKAVLDTGIRASLSRGCQKFSSEDENGTIRLKENIYLYENYHLKGNGLITVMIGPHAPYTCIPDYLKECFSTAKSLGIGMHIHLAETKTEIDTITERYGKPSVELCYELGILDDTVVGAHCVHINQNEIEMLKETGVNIAHNPTSNLKLGSGFAPISEYFDCGINICLGTDGASSNNNLNMFEEMNLVSMISKGIHNDATLIKAYDVLKMATINGAKALGLNNIGKIEEGYIADIIILDLDKPHFYPRHNMLSNLVYSAQGSDVDTVIVNGEILLKNREYTKLDFEKIKFNIEKIYKRIF